MSYEYAVGAINTSPFRLLGDAQLLKMQNMSRAACISLLNEFGYDSSTASISEKTEQHLCRVTDFLMSIAPDPELVGCMLFEQDSHNMKLLLKSKISGTDCSESISQRGFFDPELIRICINANDFSALGEVIEKRLSGIEKEKEPFIISSVCDNAFFANAFNTAKLKGSKDMQKYLSLTAEGKNKAAVFRSQLFGDNRSICLKYLLGSYSDDIVCQVQKYKSVQQIYDEADMSISSFLCSSSPIIEFIKLYYLKNKEAAAVRLLFAGKQDLRQGAVI